MNSSIDVKCTSIGYPLPRLSLFFINCSEDYNCNLKKQKPENLENMVKHFMYLWILLLYCKCKVSIIDVKYLGFSSIKRLLKAMYLF